MTEKKENYFLAQLKNQKFDFFVSSLLSALGAAFGLVPYYLIYAITSYFYFDKDQDPNRLLFLTLLGIGAVCVKGIFWGVSGHISHKWSYWVLFNIRVQLADKWSQLPLGYFNRNTSGELKKIIHEDVEALEIGLAHAIPDMVSALTVPVLTSILMFYIDWRMALAIISFVPVIFFFYALTFAPSKGRIQNLQKAMSEVNRVVVQYLQGMKVIKIFTRSDTALAEFVQVMDRFTDMIKKFSSGSIQFIALLTIAIRANVIVILPVGTWLYLDNSLDLPAFVFFLLVGLGFNLPFLKLGTSAGRVLQPVIDSGKRINGILEMEGMKTDGIDASPGNTTIEFKNVSFSYDDTEVLKNISLKLKENSVTALVGPSGAGKSTIAQLIPRFWDIEKGEILMGGKPVREYSMGTLMSTVSFVFQDPYLFNDTIFQNIKLGNPRATEAEIYHAAKLAQVDEFIDKLPGKYDTKVGERGDRLSGGQKQRVAIARAILKNAPILILDEATSFIDPYCEIQIQKALNALTRNKTVLVIAHRLSTVANADNIILINNGRIEAEGRHQALVESSELYLRLWNSFQSDDSDTPQSLEGKIAIQKKPILKQSSREGELRENPYKEIANKGLWGMLLTLVDKHRGQFKKALFYHFIENMVSGAPVIFTFLVILELLQNDLKMYKVWLYMGMILVSFAIQGIFNYLGSRNLWQVHAEAPGELKKYVGIHLKKLPLGFYNTNDTGSISTLLTNDIQTLNLVTTPTQMVRVVSSTFITSIALLLIDWRLGLVTLSTLPFALIALSWGDKVFIKVWQTQTESRSAANSEIIDFLQGIKVIRSLNLSGSKFSGFYEQMARFRDSSMDTALKLTPSLIVFTILLEMGFVVTLGVGAYFYMNGLISFSIFLFYLFVGLFFYIPFSELADISAYRRVLKNSMTRIQELLSYPTLPEPEEDSVPENFNITLEDVSFSYDEEKVLNNVSIEIPENKITALVGPSGSGKTTITNLVVRFWDPDSGTVKLGGIDLKDMRSTTLLSNISMVFQDVYLFQDSIMENVRLGNTKASDEDVFEACRLARCHDFITAMPEGYQTIVGEGGSTLSGGEKQRISIARAILKDSPILLLDEATASIDPENELLIQQVLNELMKDKTIIIIAHRLSTIQSAAKIVVLENGKVAQEGDHASLYPKEGIYRKFWLARHEASEWTIPGSKDNEQIMN